MKAVLIILGLFAVSSCKSQGASAASYIVAQNYIVECATDWAESVVTGDMTKRREYFADEFQGTGVGGERYDRAMAIRERGPSKVYESNVIGPIEVRFFGSTAIAYGEETWTKFDGTSGRWIWTDIWIERDGKWQVIAAQDNEVAHEL